MTLASRQRISEQDNRIYELEAELRDIRGRFDDVHRFLDSLGAPRQQDNGFGYSPLGRLSRVAYQSLGEGLKKMYDERLSKASVIIENLKDENASLKERIKELEDGH